MNLQQIKDERKWNECLLDVQSVGKLYLVATRSPNQNPCLAQKVEVIDGVGEYGTITVYSKDETFAVRQDELGPQSYKLRYKGSYEGYPTEPYELDIGENLMKAPPQERKQRDLPPAGTQLAICYHVVDIGTHQKIYPGKPAKNVRLIRLGWELPACRHKFDTDDGLVDKPFAIWEEYTFSTYVKANLSMLIVPWMGECSDDFAFESLVGAACYLSIVHQVGGDGYTYANVKGAMQLPPTVEVPALFNERQFYDLTEMGNNFPAWLLDEKINWLLQKIMSCQEFKAMEHAGQVIKASGLETQPVPQDDAFPPIDDDIPF